MSAQARGALPSRLREHGVDAWGVDYPIHVNAADEDVRPHLRLEDITEPHARRPIVSWSQYRNGRTRPCRVRDTVDKSMRRVRSEWRSSPTAAAPNQGGHDHVNEQPMFYYWVDRFRARGCQEVDEVATQKLKHAWSPITRMRYAANVCVFRRAVAKDASMRTDLVSVVVPCHMQSHFAEALDSVRVQTYPFVEVIVVTGDEAPRTSVP